jgi:uncharacterized protein with von Willebrand factor type A (vWA) domain
MKSCSRAALWNTTTESGAEWMQRLTTTFQLRGSTPSLQGVWQYRQSISVIQQRGAAAHVSR